METSQFQPSGALPVFAMSYAHLLIWSKLHIGEKKDSDAMSDINKKLSEAIKKFYALRNLTIFDKKTIKKLIKLSERVQSLRRERRRLAKLPDLFQTDWKIMGF